MSFEAIVDLRAPIAAIGRGQFCVELSAEAAGRLGEGRRIPVMALADGLMIWGNVVPRRGGGHRFYLPNFLLEDFLDKQVGDLIHLQLRPPKPDEPGGSRYQPYFLPGGKVRPVADDPTPAS